MSRVCSRQLIATVFKIHVSLQSEFVSPPSQTIFRRRGEGGGNASRNKEKVNTYSRAMQVEHPSKYGPGDVEKEDLYTTDPRDVRRGRVLQLVGGVVRLEYAEREDLACLMCASKVEEGEGEQSYTRITKGINQHTFPACTSSLIEQRTHRKQSYI